jgi:putative aldouronate transport system permease protein
LSLFTFVGKWNDWFVGLTYVQDKKLQPIMTILQRMQRQLDMLKQMTPENAMMNAEMLKNIPGASARMAITFVAMFPLLVCYPFFQKYFIKGLTVGSVKG